MDQRKITIAIALAAVSFVAIGASMYAFQGQDQGNRVFLIGWDGVDPRALDELLAEGKMPNTAALIERGTYGRIQSPKPSFSPAIWTSVVTGVHRDVHGIRHFWKGKKGSDDQDLYTSRDRQVAAMWDITTAADKSTDVLGWWATWPAETISGTLVSDRFAFNRMGVIANVLGDYEDSSGDVDGLYSPPEDARIIEPCRVAATDAKAPILDRLRALDPSVSGISAEAVGAVESFVAQDETNHCLTMALLERGVPEVMLAFYENTDIAGHMGWGYRYPQEYRRRIRQPPPPERAAAMRGIIEEAYVLQDQRLAEILKYADDRTTIIVMSDHGMHVGADHMGLQYTGQHTAAPDGIFIIAGASIREGSILEGATMYDVLPTMLTLAGLPVAADIDGRVLDEILLSEEAGGPVRLPMVASHPRGPLADLPASGTEGDDLRSEQLKQMGYVEED